jgi:hypothetical protein
MGRRRRWRRGSRGAIRAARRCRWGTRARWGSRGSARGGCGAVCVVAARQGASGGPAAVAAWLGSVREVELRQGGQWRAVEVSARGVDAARAGLAAGRVAGWLSWAPQEGVEALRVPLPGLRESLWALLAVEAAASAPGWARASRGQRLAAVSLARSGRDRGRAVGRCPRVAGGPRAGVGAAAALGVAGLARRGRARGAGARWGAAGAARRGGAAWGQLWAVPPPGVGAGPGWGGAGAAPGVAWRAAAAVGQRGVAHGPCSRASA